jgi:hypothetical protein
MSHLRYLGKNGLESTAILTAALQALYEFKLQVSSVQIKQVQKIYSTSQLIRHGLHSHEFGHTDKYKNKFCVSIIIKLSIKPLIS